MAMSEAFKKLVRYIERFCELRSIPLTTTLIGKLIDQYQFTSFVDFYLSTVKPFDYTKIEKVKQEKIDEINEAMASVWMSNGVSSIFAWEIVYILGIVETKAEAVDFVINDLKSTPVRGTDYTLRRWMDQMDSNILIEASVKRSIRQELRWFQMGENNKAIVILFPDVDYELPKPLVEKAPPAQNKKRSKRTEPQ